MITLSKDCQLTSEDNSDLGIYAQWQFGNTIPSTTTELSKLDVFPVRDIKDRGEYFTRPSDATGLVVLSSEKLSVMAAWRNKEHKGPWQVYGEQEPPTTAYYLVGDTDVVFVGWV
ncbi:CIC11C00000004588 [Sungouiella intermedia]|uniref:CIC11C00000004588 n=1 Tax=Sungouiella intermedia TaxID=45354 RepID=A0A1L0DBL1_9ASCO|nr:CIC11C00000004588 [[Candida] intermedia]